MSWDDIDIMIAEADYESSMNVIRRFYEIMVKSLKNGRKLFVCNELSDALSKVGINDGLFKNRLKRFIKSNENGTFDEFIQFYYEND